MLPRTLQEACFCTQVWGITASRQGGSLDKPEDDFVKRYEEFRDECPHKHESSHNAFCERCDNSYPHQTGGADYLRKQGVVVTNPFEKFPEPLKPRAGPKVSPQLWEHLGSFIPRVPLAPKEVGRKIKGPSEFTAQENILMADTEATRALFRELLGMTGGANAGGRGTLYIPDESMDSLSGDAAQENMARESLIMEMKRREGPTNDPRYVGLDLMEMEADHVDEFLKNARKKIIKRSKPTRKACCSRIGGVLDQLVGPLGGDYADEVSADDRGKHDPIGDADGLEAHKEIKEGYNGTALEPRRRNINPGLKVSGGPSSQGMSEPRRAPASARLKIPTGGGRGTSALGKGLPGRPTAQFNWTDNDDDLLSFIAEEFFPGEHDADCELASVTVGNGLLGESRGRSNYGLLRDRYGLRTGQQFSLDVLLRDHARLAESDNLVGPDRRLFERLELFLKNIKSTTATTQEEEVTNMDPSRTASALSGFMESSSAVNRYKAADAGSGKGAPDSGQASYSQAVGQLKTKTRDDNSEYPTALAAVKGGGNASKTSGDPQSLSTRGKDRGDPIGENLSPDHIAVYKFRSEAPEARQARISHYKETGEVMESEETTRRISETASALSGFMESTGQYAAAKERLNLKGVSETKVKTRSKQELGSPLESAKKVRQQADVKDDGGKESKNKKGYPIGGAHDSGAFKN